MPKKRRFWTAPALQNFAEGTKFIDYAVFGPQAGQKLHNIWLLVPSAE
jgi:hypothetical protein